MLLAPKEGGEDDEQGLFCKEVVFFYGGVGGSVMEEGASYCAIIGVDHGRRF